MVCRNVCWNNSIRYYYRTNSIVSWQANNDSQCLNLKRIMIHFEIAHEEFIYHNYYWNQQTLLWKKIRKHENNIDFNNVWGRNEGKRRRSWRLLRHKVSQRQRTFQRRVIPPTMAWYIRCTGFNRRKERAAASSQQEEEQAGEHNWIPGPNVEAR